MTTVVETQLGAFRARCEEVAGRPLPDPVSLHDFSVSRFRDFWRLFLDWSALAWEGSADPVCVGDDVETAVFFPEVRLNYVENLLRPLPDADDTAPALTSVHADRDVERFTRGELRAAVQRTAGALRRLGVGEATMVGAVGPNCAAMAICALAVAGLGATLSTATPDMGPSALLGRLGQMQPDVLVVDRRGMGSERSSADDALRTVLAGLASVRQLLLLDDLPLPDVGDLPMARLAELEGAAPAVTDWPRLPFNHPLWVMYSSGTTGPPKAMVHGAGGTLLEHLKEHRLHGDLGPRDTLYFHTTSAWMMWNWQLSALAVGAHIVLNDAPISGAESLWELVGGFGVTVFGTSPAYLQLCQDEGYRPRNSVDLGRLRAVMSTGAVLHPWQFDWVADAVGDVPVQSISGGTDIIGCFVLGHPERPVQAGRCQSLSLGLDVAAVDDDGRPVLGEVGDLVCRQPFPSRPVRFLQDPDGARFHAAYFAEHAGVWTHGDRIEIAPDGSSRMYGRSDGVLNVDGVRIGPSEIYTIVRRLPEIADAMAVEQRDPAEPGRTRLVLLVVMRAGASLDDALTTRIRSTLRREGSPAHVPSIIAAVPELPVTHNGKRSEAAARAVLDGREVRNVSALKNPGALAAIATAVQGGTADVDLSGCAGDLAGAVAAVFARFLGRPVPEDANFFDLGGTSRQSVTMLRVLRTETGRSLTMPEFLADPSVRGVTSRLAAGGADTAVVEVRTGDASLAPLYLLHSLWGDVDSYQGVINRLDTARPVHGLTGRALLEEPGTSMAAIAAAHVRTLQRVQPEGPLLLAGFSFGGVLAYEMARQLSAAGRRVALLAVIDSRAPHASLTRGEYLCQRLGGAMARLIPGFAENGVWRALAAPLRGTASAPVDEVLEDSTRLYNSTVLQPYAGAVTYFRCRRRIPVLTHMLRGWRRVASDLSVVGIPGAHHDLLGGRKAEVLARKLSAALRTVPER